MESEPNRYEEASESSSGPLRLHRTRGGERVIGGVAGGLAKYFDLDPVLVRVAFVALVFLHGLTVLLYLILMIAVPEERGDETAVAVQGQGWNGRVLVGVGLIIIGVLFLVRQLLPAFDERLIWSGGLVALGIFILVKGVRR